MGALVDATLFCEGFSKSSALKVLKIIVDTIVTSGQNITDYVTIRFDEYCAVILHCIATMSLDNWVLEDDLINKSVVMYYGAYPSCTIPKDDVKKNISDSIIKLVDHYYCLEKSDDKVRLIEQVVLDI